MPLDITWQEAGKTAALGALGGAAGFAAGQVLSLIFPGSSPVSEEQLEALFQRWATNLHDEIVRDVTAEVASLLDQDELRRISASIATVINEFRVPAGTSVRMLEQMYDRADAARTGLITLGDASFSSLLVFNCNNYRL